MRNEKIRLGCFLIFFGLSAVVAEEEVNTFQRLGCGACHKTAVSKTIPSLREIDQGYQGKEDQLIEYLKGEKEGIMSPAEETRMKRYIEKTKALSDGERKGLADFIMTHGE